MTEAKHILLILKGLVPFSALDDDVLVKVATDTVVKQYPKGSHIFLEGEKSLKVLFVVVEGEVTILAPGSQGKMQETKEQHASGFRKAGEFFGETAFLADEELYPATVLAASDLTCLLITRNSFEHALSSSHIFANYFTKALSARLRELYQSFHADAVQDRLYGQPLRRRISEVAVPRVATCLPLAKLKDVAGIMSAEGVSSVVVIAPNQKPMGIITEKDLVTKVLAADEPGLERSAYEIMSSPLITAEPHDFTYQALFLMVKHKIKHLVVADESQHLSGIVTVQDLFRSANTGALALVHRIEQQTEVNQLAALMPELDQVQQALLTERAYASEICALITELYDRVTRKIIQMAEQEMMKEGFGHPPSDYCFINMGSSGRREQFARTDQDNGIIYTDIPDDSQEEAARYFLTLGEKIVAALEICGFSRCKGGVMANNRRWCMPLSQWRHTVKQWVDQLKPHNIRDMTIFLDFRYLWGKELLYNELKEYVIRLFMNSRHALLFMAEDDLKHLVPLNFFKQIITERTGRHRRKINLKTSAGVHILDCLRLFALREGVKETNTFMRLKRLKELRTFPADEVEYMEAAYETLLMLRIRDSLQKMQQGLKPDNYIEPGVLSKKEQALLKESLLVANKLQSLTAHAFKAR